MRKSAAFILLLMMIFACFAVSFVAYADNSVSVYLDGNEISFEVPPCIINDRTLVPLRDVLQAAGAVVSWDNVDRLSVASKGDTSLWISVDNSTMTVQKGGVSYVSYFEVAPCIINNRTFIPIKPVAEVFGISVGWDAPNRCVILTSPREGVIPDNIGITGFVPPEQTSVGSSYSIGGSVTASGVLDRLNVKITDVATSSVEINETQFDINTLSYNLADIDKRVRFGTLSAGKKLLEITAVTKNETRKTFSYNFEVIRPQGAEIESGISMLWPVPDSGLITTIFWCDNPFCHSNAGRVNGHAAIDIAAPENTDVIAVSDGTVIECGFGDYENGYSGYGNFIVVDHGSGITTQYSHLYASYVNKGDIVTAGQIIAGVGNTGNSTGNHLDFNIEADGVRCDPLYYLQMHPDAKCYEECDKPYFNEAMAKRNELNP